MDVEIIFDANIYSIQTIKKAAYRNINNFSLDLKTTGNQVICNLIFKKKYDQEEIDKFVNKFRDDLLDQDLRETIKNETEGIRNLILAHTFSKTGLIKNE